jgi:hypothetical protein
MPGELRAGSEPVMEHNGPRPAKRVGTCHKDKGYLKGDAILNFLSLNDSTKKALEQQAEDVILTVQPKLASHQVREGVFRFIEQQITECFCEIPV